MGIFGKDFSVQMGMIKALMGDFEEGFGGALGDYKGGADIPTLEYPLMFVITEFAAFQTKFKGKKQIHSFEGDLFSQLTQGDKGYQHNYRTIKANLNMAVGGKVPLTHHVNTNNLCEDLNNMLMRCCVYVTLCMHDMDKMVGKENEKEYYTDISNGFYEICWMYFIACCNIMDSSY